MTQRSLADTLSAYILPKVACVTTGLQKVWQSGRSYPGNRTCSQEINQLQVK